MKQDWIVTVWKRDRRTKSGERLVNRYPFSHMDRDTVERELLGLAQQLYPKVAGWRFDVQPRTKFVKNLMTGQWVEIEANTPRSCDPSSELYWSM